MKRIQILSLLAASLMLFGGTSCSVFDKYHEVVSYKTSAETADQILIRSEQLTKQALYAFDLFVFIEDHNEALLKTVNPEIHVEANLVRANGRRWIHSLRVATAAFKENRTAGNEANLRTAYTTLTAAYDEVKKYQAEANTLSNKTP